MSLLGVVLLSRGKLGEKKLLIFSANPNQSGKQPVFESFYLPAKKKRVRCSKRIDRQEKVCGGKWDPTYRRSGAAHRVIGGTGGASIARAKGQAGQAQAQGRAGMGWDGGCA
jgi:hypothetical protein